LQTAELQAQSLDLANENASLKARIDTLELDPLRARLDSTGFESVDEQPEEPVTSEQETTPEEAPMAAPAT
jgi:hypothetical protein